MRHIAFRTASKLILQPLRRQTRGLTMGTRTVVLRGDQVLLVRHTYAPGWMFPGGGVDRGETIFASAMREVREEAGIIAEEDPVLHGMFLNDQQFPGDHVACLILRRFHQVPARSLEIAEAKFFAVAHLPDGTTGGTTRRIAEIFLGAPMGRDW